MIWPAMGARLICTSSGDKKMLTRVDEGSESFFNLLDSSYATIGRSIPPHLDPSGDLPFRIAKEERHERGNHPKRNSDWPKTQTPAERSSGPREPQHIKFLREL